METGRRLSSLTPIANRIVLAIAGISTVLAALFAIMFGVSNGLITIARGTVPLTIFGAAGYGRLVGRLAAPWLAMQSNWIMMSGFEYQSLRSGTLASCRN